MRRYSLTPKARADIAKIWFRIAKDSRTSADDVQIAIYANIDLLALSPMLGHRRPDVTTKDVLVWPALLYRNYLIVYDLRATEIRVVRVLHAARERAWRKS